jgi:hypothetical protein
VPVGGKTHKWRLMGFKHKRLSCLLLQLKEDSRIDQSVSSFLPFLSPFFPSFAAVVWPSWSVRINWLGLHKQLSQTEQRMQETVFLFLLPRSRLLSWWYLGRSNASGAAHQTSNIPRKPLPMLHWLVSGFSPVRTCQGPKPREQKIC